MNKCERYNIDITIENCKKCKYDILFKLDLIEKRIRRLEDLKAKQRVLKLRKVFFSGCLKCHNHITQQ